MKILDRLIFLLAAAGAVILSCILILFSLKLIAVDAFTQWSSYLFKELTGRQEVGLLGLLLFLLGLRLGFLGFFVPDKKGIIIQETSLGEVKVSLVAVENLIRKLLRPLSEIKEVITNIRVKKGECSVTLRLNVIPETNIPELTKRIQTLIEEGVWDVLGVRVYQVKVTISKMLAETTRVE